MQGESNFHIEPEKDLETYAKQNGFTNLRWYTDDGFSGANFQRPGFQAMLADIEAGKVGTVIVKDMSRLGRNYLQVGFYTELLWKTAHGKCNIVVCRLPNRNRRTKSCSAISRL